MPGFYAVGNEVIQASPVSSKTLLLTSAAKNKRICKPAQLPGFIAGSKPTIVKDAEHERHRFEPFPRPQSQGRMLRPMDGFLERKAVPGTCRGQLFEQRIEKLLR